MIGKIHSTGKSKVLWDIPYGFSDQFSKNKTQKTKATGDDIITN